MARATSVTQDHHLAAETKNFGPSLSPVQPTRPPCVPAPGAGPAARHAPAKDLGIRSQHLHPKLKVFRTRALLRSTPRRSCTPAPRHVENGWIRQQPLQTQCSTLELAVCPRQKKSLNGLGVCPNTTILLLRLVPFESVSTPKTTSGAAGTCTGTASTTLWYS